MRKHLVSGLSTLLASATLSPVASAQTESVTGVGRIEEVVVTAQRREETLQNAAISVDAISADDILAAGVGSNPGDLNRLVPAAQIGNNGSPYPSFYIRGVGNFTANSYTDNTVGVNYDGVSITRPASTVGMFYDLERVEVLKGPQGTLYGRNNTGGAINILPAHPVLNEFSAGVNLTAGNFSLFQGGGYVNVPLGERVALRTSANFVDRDGYYNNGNSDDVGRSGRVQLLFNPSDTFDVNLGVDYHHQSGNGGGLTLLNTPITDPSGLYGLSDGHPLTRAWREINTECDGVNDHAAPFDKDDYVGNPFAGQVGLACYSNPHLKEDFYGVTATVNWTLPWATLTVVPSVRWTDVDSLAYGVPHIHDKQDSTTRSLEVRLASDATDKFSWILGAYGLDEDIDATMHLFYAFVDVNQTVDMANKSQAVFGTARYSITDAFRVSVGARYTHDDKSFEGLDTITLVAAIPVDADKTWNKTTYRAGLELDVAEDSMLFATYETGYKAGGFFFASKELGQTFDPEKVTAYTLGSRNLFLDHRLLLNVDLFKYRYRDQQVSQFAIDPIFHIPVFPTINFGAVDYTGAEIESQFFVTEGTLLRADLQFMDSEFKNAPYLPDPNVAVPDAKDRDAPNAPDFTATLGIQQTFHLGSAGSLVADLSGQYRSDMLAGTDFTAWEYVDAKTTGDFSLRYEPTDGRWSVTGFVNNFTDEKVPTFVGGTGAVGLLVLPNVQIPPSPIRANYRAPRTYGLRVSASF